MKNLKILSVAVVIFSLLALTQVSCQKDIAGLSPANTSNLKVYLTDAPVSFDNVFIDVQMVEVKIETDSCAGDDHHDSGDDHGNSNDDNDNNNGNDDHGSDDHRNGNDDHQGEDNSCEVWDTLQLNAGVLDLLQFRNGVDALLASGAIPQGEIKAVRLTLGGNNSVVIEGITYPLNLPGNNKITIKIDDDVEKTVSDDLKLHLDFDLGSSIIQVSGNHFELKPFIKPFNEGKSGRIEGSVFPNDAKAIVTLTGNMDTLIAIPEKEGEFKIRGIRSTRFDLHFNAIAGGYRDTTISNIVIGPGQEIKLASITLHR